MIMRLLKDSSSMAAISAPTAPLRTTQIEKIAQYFLSLDQQVVSLIGM